MNLKGQFNLSDSSSVEDIAKRLKNVRMGMGYSAEFVAKKCGVARSTIIRMESGKKPFTVSLMCDYLRACSSQAMWLCFDNDKQSASYRILMDKRIITANSTGG